MEKIASAKIRIFLVVIALCFSIGPPRVQTKRSIEIHIVRRVCADTRQRNSSNSLNH
jgi:hypothetical protein